MSLRALVGIWVAAFVVPGAPMPCAQAQFAAKWREEAPPAWRKLEACLGGLDARLTVSDVTRSSDAEQRRPLETRTAIVKLAGDRGIVQAGSANFAEVWGFNHAYGFRLSKNGKAKTKWDVAFAGAVGNDATETVPLDIHHSDASRFLRAPWQLGIAPLISLVESPHFQVQAATDGALSKGIRVVDLRFTFTPPDKPAPRSLAEISWLDTPMRSGTVTLAPELSWAVLAFDLVSKGGGRTRREVTYEGLVGDLPRLRRVIDRLSGPDVVGEREIRCEVTEWQRRDIPPEEFTLTAYGLPEFVGGENQFFSRTIFLLTAIVVLSLALAAGLRLASSRRHAV